MVKWMVPLLQLTQVGETKADIALHQERHVAQKKHQSNYQSIFVPVAWAVYPIAYLYSNYIGDVYLVDTLRSLLVSVLAVLVITVFFRKLTADWNKAAVITLLLIVLHSTYGHVYNSLIGYLFGGVFLGRHELLLPLWVLTFVLGSIKIQRCSHIPSEWIRVLGTTGAGLILFVFIQMGFRYIEFEKTASAVTLDPVPVLTDNVVRSFRASTRPQPDVYYIILDGYTRDDALLDDYQFDNHEFLDFLRQKGFVIPNCAQNNFTNTAMSISTALHMNFLDTFGLTSQRGDTQRNFVVFKQFLRHNPVRENFEKLGYRWITFETNFWWADINDADLFVVTNPNFLNRLRGAIPLNPFEDKLLTTTTFQCFTSLTTSGPDQKRWGFLSDPERHYQMVVSEVDQLKEIAALEGPKAVFAHIAAPHIPFVYATDGSYLLHTDEKQGYVNAVRFINQRMRAVVEEILARSPVPPIIVIQGDHGWLPEDRTRILNAYYLPDGGSDIIYPTITPVNTFRLIFDQYFGGSYGLLPDTSIYSPEESPYQFENASTTCVNH